MTNNYICEECKREFTDSYYHDTELEYCPHCGCYDYSIKTKEDINK